MGDPKPPDPPDDNMEACPASITTTNVNPRKRPIAAQENAVNKKVISDPSQASASIQTVYSLPSFADKKTYDSQTDKGPYIVQVSRTEDDPAAGSTIRSLKFGQFLFKNGISNIKPDGVKNVGRNRISIEFKTADAANVFLEHPSLTPAKYSASIPAYNISRMGLARGIPVDFSMEELVHSVVVPDGFGSVVRARRLNRKTFVDGVPTWIPTQSVVLTFAGQTLPPRVFSYHSAISIENYLLPTIQCLNCCHYGHIKTQCRSKSRCFKCAQPHQGEECNVVNPSCLHCAGSHPANSPNCPELNRQKSIKVVMSQENLSFQEASARFPKTPRKPYSEVASALYGTNTHNSIAVEMEAKKTHSQSHSHTKTVTQTRHPHSPASTGGYNIQAHRDLVQTPLASLPNGCALEQSNGKQITPHDNLLEILTAALTSIISRFEPELIPNNIRTSLTQLLTALNYGSSGPTVEL